MWKHSKDIKNYIIKKKSEIFGGYTEDKWDKNPPYTDLEFERGSLKNHNSFLFKFNMNKDFDILKHKTD